MTGLSSRAALAAGLLIPLIAACGGGSSPETAPRPSQRSTDAATIDAKDMEREHSGDIEKVLAGRVAGVVVSRSPEGGIAVRIRGSTSLMGSSDPLYILDGMPIIPGPNGSLSGVNPYDIDSIRVLKDPADTAMYGSRGANGVIIIKTKQGKKPPQ